MFILCASLLISCIVCYHGASVNSLPSMMLGDWKEIIMTWQNTANNEQLYDPDHPTVRDYHFTGVSSFRHIQNFAKTILTQDTFYLKVGTTEYSEPKLWNQDCKLDYNTNAWECNVWGYNKKNLDFTLSYKIVAYPSSSFYNIIYNVNDKKGRTITLLSYSIHETDSEYVPGWGWKNDAEKDIFMYDGTKTGQGYFASTYSLPNGISVAYAIGSPNAPSTDAVNILFTQKKDLADTEYHENKAISIGIAFKSYTGRIDNVVIMRAISSDYDNVMGVVNASPMLKNPTADTILTSAKNGVITWMKTSPLYNKFTNKSFFENTKRYEFFLVSLLFMKNSLNPKSGAPISSFHNAYGLKVWSRDALFCLAILDSAGFTDEAEKGLEFFSTVQLSDKGIFHTTYNFFTGEIVWFVEPQLDALGVFPLVVLYHKHVMKKLRGKQWSMPFLIENRLKEVGNTLMKKPSNGDNITANFSVMSDFSIWEESSSPITGENFATGFFAFSQTASFSGLRAMAKLTGDSKYENRAEELRVQILDKLWLKDEKFLGRQMWDDGSHVVEKVVDSSTSAALWSGLIKDEGMRDSHLKRIQTVLQRDEYGLARYDGDVYFCGTGHWSPGINECLDSEKAMPAWPVITLFTSWSEDASMREKRLQWTVTRTAWGGMPIGEAVDPDRDEFIWSSAPDIYEHAGIYVITELYHNGAAEILNVDDISN